MRIKNRREINENGFYDIDIILGVVCKKRL